MTTRLLLSTWHWHPSVLLGCAALVIAYLAALRLQWTPRIPVFIAGVLTLLIALLSPLHELGDHYLFSAHMLQHLLLLLIVPPLLLLGLPVAMIDALLRRRRLRAIERVLGQPLLAWSIGIGMMWLWHLPTLYNAALNDELIHIVEHLAFLGSAMIFWWPVCLQGVYARLHPLAALIYLFAAMLASGVLGIILTFAEPGWYPAYLNPRDSLGILPLLWGEWGLTPAVDQQVGGLLMWVPGSFVYLVAIIAVTARWYGAAEEEQAAPRVQATNEPGTLTHDQRRMLDVK
jgi:putative membrane protein